MTEVVLEERKELEAGTTRSYYGPEPRRIIPRQDRRRRMDRFLQKLRALLTPEEQEALLNCIDKAATPEEVSGAEQSLIAALSGGFATTPGQAAANEVTAFIQYFQYRRALLAGALTTSDVAALLGTTRQTPYDRARNGSLLAVMDRGAWRFPAWQFDPEGPDGVVQGLPAVLRALRLSPLGKASWLTRPNPFLDNKTPLDVLKNGEIERVLAEARSVGVPG
jgi:excisionase family DNA binding protein